MQIAISYRRDDSSDITGRIWDRLASRYAHQVFMDIDGSIPLGTDYRKYLQGVFEHVSIVLAVVGGRWRGRVRQGKARIQNPDDPVRLEIEMALRNEKRVVPLLVHDAKMPPISELPETLQPFHYLQYLKIESRTNDDFHRHVDKLMDFLDGQLTTSPPEQSNVED